VRCTVRPLVLVNNLRAEYQAKGWGWGKDQEMIQMFLVLDIWVGRACGAMFFGTFTLSLLLEPAWRRRRYEVYARIYAHEDLHQRKPFWWCALARLLWLPLPFLVFMAWLVISWSPSRDFLLWPFAEFAFRRIQEYLCGGGGLLRGTKGPIRLIGALLWNHPVSNLFFWSLILAALTLAERVLLGHRRERRSAPYQAALSRAGRCWRCRYARVPAQQPDGLGVPQTIVCCPECGEPY
jgi:hypothetical protein